MSERPDRLIRGAVFACMGAFSMASQTALFREYLVVYGGNELGAGFFYASWLGWVGVGALAALLWLRRRPTAKGRFPLLLVLYPAALLVQIVAIRSLRTIAGVEPTDLFPTGSLFLATLLTNAPVSLATGLLFPLAAAGAEDAEAAPGRAVSRVYVLECLGSFAGGAGVTGLLLTGRGALVALPAVAGCLAASGLILSLRRRSVPGTAANGVVLATAALLLLTPAGPFVLRTLDEEQVADLYPDAKLIATAESPYRRLAVVSIGSQRLALANGRILSAWPGGGAETAEAALLLSQPSASRAVALIGDGLEPLVAEMVRYPVGRIVLLLPDADGHRFLLDEIPGARAALEDPRVTVRYGDPRATLREDDAFDLVVVAPGEPDSALAARFYTREFYAIVAARLADGGVLATPLASAENYFGTELTRYGASVRATLEAVFPVVAATPGEKAWFLAGNVEGHPSVEAGILEARLSAMTVRERRFEPERMHQLLEPRRVAFVREVYATRGDEDLVSTDAKPLTFFLNLLVLSRLEGGSLAPAVLAIRSAGIGIFLLPLAVVLMFRLRYAVARPDPAGSDRFAGAFLLVLVGGASLALDLTLLLAFQERFGLLFLDVGLANALFMLGLTVGGVAGTALARARPGRLTGFAGAAACAAAAFALLLTVLTGAAGSRATFLSLFLLAGALCGTPFPLAAALAARGGATAGGAAGLLECADHWGGAAGAALAGVLLVPLFGTGAAARLTGIALLAAPALLLLETAVRRGIPDRVIGAARLARMRSRLTTFPFVAAGFVLAAAVVSAVLVSYPVRAELDRPVLRLPAERLRRVVRGRARITSGFEGRCIPPSRVAPSRLPVGVGSSSRLAGRAHRRSRSWEPILARPLTADRILEVDDPFLHYDAWNEGDDAPLNHTLATRAVVSDVSGYGGPLNLLLSVDRDARIREVSLLRSKETPAYIRDLPEFLARFAGRSAEDEATLDDLVNVTGATVTCRAVVETVNRANERVVTDLLGRPSPPRAERPGLLSGVGKSEIAILLALALAVPVFLRGSGRVRTVFLVAVLGVLGVWQNQQISTTSVIDLLTLHLPPTGNTALLLLVGGVLILSLLFGQIYCGLLCPFGAAQELLGRLGLLVRVSPGLDRRARFLKHVVLAAAAVLFLLFGAERVTDFDPLGVAFGLKAQALMWVLIGAILFFSLFSFRFWCRYLCPVGAFFSLFNRIALLRRYARPKDYRRCDLGTRSKIDMDCLHCNRCITREPMPEVTP